MGAAQSSQPGTGLITVSSGAPDSQPEGDEALLAHLWALRQRSKAVGAPGKGDGDPFRDLEVAKAIVSDTQQLGTSIESLLSEYQRFHDDHASAILQNQTAVVHRLINQADIRAKNAAQHTRLQAARIKALAQQLSVVRGLPEQLATLCDQAAALQSQLARLSELAPGPAAAARAGQGTGGSGEAAR